MGRVRCVDTQSGSMPLCVFITLHDSTLAWTYNQCPRECMDARCQVPADWLQPPRTVRCVWVIVIHPFMEERARLLPSHYYCVTVNESVTHQTVLDQVSPHTGAISASHQHVVDKKIGPWNLTGELSCCALVVAADIRHHVVKMQNVIAFLRVPQSCVKSNPRWGVVRGRTNWPSAS